MRSRAPLVLMEQLVMVLVFALAAAICVRAFALADTLSKGDAARDAAAFRCQSMAEVWKNCGGDATAAAAQYGGTVEQGLWRVFYDGAWKPVGDRADAAYEVSLLVTDSGAGLRRAGVQACAETDSAPIFSLEIACQEALG